jgi:nucleoside-diphosphate-sugar epimerase
MKILITGGNGYISKNISEKLRIIGHTVISPTKQEMNVTNFSDVKLFVEKTKPDVIIHAASKGGYRDVPDTHEVFVENVMMFETLIKAIPSSIPIIFYTSGADFDRRNQIKQVIESNVVDRWPIDPYGLSKNLIVRRILQEKRKNISILRIFAAFNEDEKNMRFIKKSILNIKEGLPITIHQNREIDFVYIDDLVTVTDYLLNKLINNQFHINISYINKTTLLDVSKIICKYTNHLNPKITILNEEEGLSYSGSGQELNNFSLPLIGLEEGISRTISKLI